MKITKSRLKEIIFEIMQEDAHDPDQPMTEPRYTPYEQDDMSTDHQMVQLLGEIVAQLKMLNRYMTPAKTPTASGTEKALAGLTVAEGEE